MQGKKVNIAYCLVVFFMLNVFGVQIYSMEDTFHTNNSSIQACFDGAMSKVVRGELRCDDTFFRQCKVLLDSGANPNCLYKGYLREFTPLTYACKFGAMELAKFFLDYSSTDINCPDTSRTPLMWACIQSCIQLYNDSSGKSDMVQFLLERGADPNKEKGNSSWQTPLICALEHERYDIAKLLLRYNADPNIKNQRGRTALFYVKTNSDMLYDLLMCKADVHCKDVEGLSVLHAFCKDYCFPGRAEFNACISLLIVEGLNINAQDDKGNTPLHYMVRNNTSVAYYMITVLLAHHANPLIKNNEGKTVYNLAGNEVARQALQRLGQRY